MHEKEKGTSNGAQETVFSQAEYNPGSENHNGSLTERALLMTPTRAEIEAFLAKAEANDAAAAEQLARLGADLAAGQRRHDAYKLVPGFADEELRAAVEQALAELPTEPLDDAALIKLKHRHEAQQLVKKLAELKGPLSAATEQTLQQKFEQAIERNNNVRT